MEINYLYCIVDICAKNAFSNYLAQFIEMNVTFYKQFSQYFLEFSLRIWVIHIFLTGIDFEQIGEEIFYLGIEKQENRNPAEECQPRLLVEERYPKADVQAQQHGNLITG